MTPSHVMYGVRSVGAVGFIEGAKQDVPLIEESKIIN